MATAVLAGGAMTTGELGVAMTTAFGVGLATSVVSVGKAVAEGNAMCCTLTVGNAVGWLSGWTVGVCAVGNAKTVAVVATGVGVSVCVGNGDGVLVSAYAAVAVTWASSVADDLT